MMNYERETRSLLNRMIEKGFKLIEVYDGEETIPVSTPEEAIKELMATDETYLIANTPDGDRVTLMLIYGNDPGELVANYTCNPLVDALVDEHYNSFG